MKKLLLLTIILLISFTAVYAETSVTYVSAEGIYINAGTNAGLQKGDTLIISRNNQTIATLIVQNISTKSAACLIISQTETPLTSDLVLHYDGSVITVTEADIIQSQINTASDKKVKSRPVNRINGFIALQQYYQKDFTSSSLSTYQPSLKTKLKIENINNSNLTFKMSLRSRYYHRSKQISVFSTKNEWSHRLYEFAVYGYHENLNWSFGRQSIYQARGIGYIDGLYIARQMDENLILGGAFGSEPNYLNQKIDFNRKKAALFVSYEKGTYETGRYILSAAFAGSYISGEINREFFNFSADYYTERFSTNHAVEFDIFRSWRKDALGKSIKFANYYGRVNYNLSSRIRFNLSYDNRNQIRYFDDVYIADSLFDNSSHQGVNFGTSVKVNQSITFSANTGIRFRSDELDNNKFVNTSLNFSRFPAKHNSLSFRFAYVQTMFTNAYRPSVAFRFPLFTRMHLTASASSNIYKTGSNSTTSTYLDLNSYYSFDRIYFMSASIRQYLDKELRSSQIYFELGRNF